MPIRALWSDGRENLLGALLLAGQYVIPEVPPLPAVGVRTRPHECRRGAGGGAWWDLQGESGRVLKVCLHLTRDLSCHRRETPKIKQKETKPPALYFPEVLL